MLLISISTFICIAFGVMAIYWLAFRPASATAARLRELDEERGGVVQSIEYTPVANIAERIADPISRILPPSAANAKKLQKELMQAGFRSHSAPAIYRATQFLLTLALPALIYLVWMVWGRPLNGANVPALFALGAGFILPRFVLNRLIASRQLKITWGLADALDLMVITMEAGLGLNAAMVKVCEELKDVHPDISKEFELANLEIRVGRERSEALRNLADRSGATVVAARAREELVAAGGRPRRPAVSGVDALTASERRVVALAAEGLSNREIAERLFVTQRTVETHLGHAFAKLGVRRRDQLTRLGGPHAHR